MRTRRVELLKLHLAADIEVTETDTKDFKDAHSRRRYNRAVRGEDRIEVDAPIDRCFLLATSIELSNEPFT